MPGPNLVEILEVPAQLKNMSRFQESNPEIHRPAPFTLTASQDDGQKAPLVPSAVPAASPRAASANQPASIAKPWQPNDLRLGNPVLPCHAVTPCQKYGLIQS